MERSKDDTAKIKCQPLCISAISASHVLGKHIRVLTGTGKLVDTRNCIACRPPATFDFMFVYHEPVFKQSYSWIYVHEDDVKLYINLVQLHRHRESN